MPENENRRPEAPGRRLFLSETAVLCAAGMSCLARPCAAAVQQAQPATAAAPPQEGFGADSKMSFKQVYAFAFTQALIPLLVELAKDAGREKFVATLQEVASRAAVEQVRKTAPPPPKNTLAALVGPEQQDYFWSHVLSMKRIENTETAVEVRVTSCLWAETFRAAGAADIGYACICHSDFAAASAFNPKLRMTRTKTLMQGNEYCNHRWVLEKA